jgi:hypothetical protein
MLVRRGRGTASKRFQFFFLEIARRAPNLPLFRWFFVFGCAAMK